MMHGGRVSHILSCISIQIIDPRPHSVCCYLLSSHRITLRHMARGMWYVIEGETNLSNEKEKGLTPKNVDGALANNLFLNRIWNFINKSTLCFSNST